VSSESIVSAIFLITAVVAAAVLVNAIFPIITQTGGTFGSVSHQADTRIRTDIRIVNAWSQSGYAKIWLKNVGSERISDNEMDGSDMFLGATGNFGRMALENQYNKDLLGNGWWDPGETLEIAGSSHDGGVGVYSTLLPTTAGDAAYFSIVLPNGVTVSEEFKVS
jgi:flagellar protein FlaG